MGRWGDRGRVAGHPKYNTSKHTTTNNNNNTDSNNNHVGVGPGWVVGGSRGLCNFRCLMFEMFKSFDNSYIVDCFEVLEVYVLGLCVLEMLVIFSV